MATQNSPQDDTQTGAQGGKMDPALQWAMPTGAEVHDALMAPLEKDLTTGNLAKLHEKYAGETPEDRAQRIERYKTALQKYDVAFSAWVSGINEKVNTYKQAVLSHAERQSSEKDAGEITRLESEISDVNDE